ncbi:amidohydrolase family protein [Paraburkholderia megapolitana]|uniref:amidohydrolase family protein n=1 Tax=Paraburkholderia megapolitana TaxID=420953 RepID=UPI0038B81E7E
MTQSPVLPAFDAARSGDTPATAVARWYRTDPVCITAVDTHAHVFVRGLPLAPQRRHAPDYDATLDDYVAHLCANRISHAVLVQPSFLGTDNSFLLDVLRRYPRRFRGVVVVDPAIDPEQLVTLAHAGVVGIRLNLLGLPLPDLRDARWRALFERINAFGWHVEVHREAADLPQIVGALLDADCTVVVDHFGRPDPLVAADDPGLRFLLGTASSGRVWVKLSAAYRSAVDTDGMQHGQRLAALLLEHFTPARLVWGSDWPHTQHQHLVDYDATCAALAQWVPEREARETILVGSPRRLFRFD